MIYHHIISGLIIAYVAIVGAGCTHTLPQYQWLDANTALSTMSTRDDSVQTFSSTFTLLLQSGEGQVELTGAMVARPPNQVRLRAWKMTRSVLDITLNDEGLFIYSADRKRNEKTPTGALSYQRLIEALTILPGFGDISSWEIGTTANPNNLLINYPSSQNTATCSCTIDKTTLTTRTCTYHDEQGKIRYKLKLENYQFIQQIAWPMLISGIGDSGNFEIRFSHIEINDSLSKRAFTPSRRAKKQP